MALTLTNRAWTKLNRISSLTQNPEFLLTVNANKHNGLFYGLLPYNSTHFKKKPLNYDNITNGRTNTVYVDPFLENIVESMKIDYQKSNYEEEVFESRFIFDASYPTPYTEPDLDKKHQNKYKNINKYYKQDESYYNLIYNDEHYSHSESIRNNNSSSWHVM
jgi:Fe-S cluster assembly iron-binding protein IscA